MPKVATPIFTCTKCDAQHPKWFGQCPTCDAWGTVAQGAAAPHSRTASLPHIATETIPTLHAASDVALPRTPTGISEFDIALGGGIVGGGVLLLAGEPGIGKSTLILTVASAMAAHGTVLYVSGEETAAQVRNRADRLGVPSERIRFLATNDGSAAAAAVQSLRPVVAIVDSIQTLSLPDVPADAGGVTHVRALTSTLTAAAKSSGIPVILIGHVTKDGSVAGPKTLEHLVDQVAILEGEPGLPLRMLRTTKNRYGATDVVGIFTMTERGLEPMPDPGAAFRTDRKAEVPGSAVAITVQGNRTLLIEIQTLATRSSMGPPQRRTLGIDVNRLHVLLAVLAERGGVSLASSDVHAVTTGGFKVTDPGADLALLAALASAATGRAVPFDACVGTVGLDGSIRAVPALDRRIREAARLGCRTIAAPPETAAHRGITIIPIASAHECVRALAAKGR